MLRDYDQVVARLKVSRSFNIGNQKGMLEKDSPEREKFKIGQVVNSPPQARIFLGLVPTRSDGMGFAPILMVFRWDEIESYMT